MSDTSHSPAIPGLKWAAGLIGGFGILTALAAIPALAPPILMFADLVTWPMAGAEGLTTPEGRLVLAIAGGITFGWGVTLWMLADVVSAAQAAAIRRVIIAGFIAWFCLDSTMSVMAGAPLNVLGNIGFLAALLIPMRQRAGTERAPV